MNRLSTAERARIIGCLTEGVSIRATSRLTGASQNTILKLLVDLGRICADYQDHAFRDLPCRFIECDEIWSFCYSRAKNVPAEHKGEFGFGDVWTFTAIDADTKLMPAWMIGDRTPETALAFMQDLAARVQGSVQLSTDGHRMYLRAVPGAFGRDIDYGQLVKFYGVTYDNLGKAQGTSEVIGFERKVISGDPVESRISTSYIERSNLTLRMGNRRFTRLTNAFSKRVENHAASISLFMFHYNFGRTHRSLANPYPRTPAMAAGVADHIWTLEEIAGLAE